MSRSVLADPDDIEARRAFAKGTKGPRGRFVSLQLAGKVKEAEDLALEHEVAWLEPLLATPPFSRFQRRPFFEWRDGFVEHVVFDEHDGGGFDVLWEHQPVTSIEVVANKSDTFVAIAGASCFDRVRDLTLSVWSPLSAIGTKRPRLRKLHAHVQSAEDLETLRTLPLEELEDLSLGSRELAAEVAEWLVGASLPALRRLTLDGPMGRKIAKKLFAAGALQGLRHLGLANADLKAPGTKALAAASFLPELESLAVTSSGCGKNITLIPLKATKLVSLNVSGPKNGLNAKGMAAFLESLTGLKKLRSLSLGSSAMRQIGTEALATVPDLWKRIERLDLGGNTLKDVGAKALAKVAMPALRELDLQGNGIGAPGMDALAQSGFLAEIRSLDLSENKFQAKGGKALAGAPKLALEELTLRYNWLGIKGLQPILRHDDAHHLRRLHLLYNNYEHAPLAELAKSETVTKLEELTVFRSTAEDTRHSPTRRTRSASASSRSALPRRKARSWPKRWCTASTWGVCVGFRHRWARSPKRSRSCDAASAFAICTTSRDRSPTTCPSCRASIRRARTRLARGLRLAPVPSLAFFGKTEGVDDRCGGIASRVETGPGGTERAGVVEPRRSSAR